MTCRTAINHAATKQAAYIPHSKADKYREKGWNVTPFNNHHGTYSMLATRTLPRLSVVIPRIQPFPIHKKGWGERIQGSGITEMAILLALAIITPYLLSIWGAQ